MDQNGGEKKTKKTKKSSTATKEKKTTTKKTTKTNSKVKGGNFLGTVGDLVAPTGWGTFATAAGLLALDRADAALRRGTKEKKEKMKGGKKSEKKDGKKDVKNMRGGEITCNRSQGYVVLNKNNGGKETIYEYKLCCKTNGSEDCETRQFNNSQQNPDSIFRSMQESLKRKLEN